MGADPNKAQIIMPGNGLCNAAYWPLTTDPCPVPVGGGAHWPLTS